MALDAYLQIDGIKGESADSAHQGWIEVASTHWGVTQPRVNSVSTAGGHTAGHCEHRTLSLTKLADLASPATIKLVGLFLQHPVVKLIYFNDAKVRKVCGPLVKPWPDHDDHLHIGLWERR